MRRRNPLLDPVTDLLDQLTYPNSAPRGPTLPAYLAQTQASPSAPMLSGRPSQFAPSQAGPMVRQPAAPDEFMVPPAQHTGIPAGLAQLSPAMMADPTPEDEPMHGFAPPDSDPSLNAIPGAPLISGPELRARMLDARIRGGHEDMSTNQAALRRTMAIQRMQQQATMAPMTQDGVRPSPLGPNTVRDVLRSLVQASNAYADAHPNRPHAGRRPGMMGR